MVATIVVPSVVGNTASITPSDAGTTNAGGAAAVGGTAPGNGGATQAGGNGNTGRAHATVGGSTQVGGGVGNTGVNVVRWWIWPDFRSDGVAFSGNNATGLSGTMTQDINKALELAARYDLYIMLDLFSFDPFRGTAGNGPNLKDIATNATARSALIAKALRPVARAVASSPNEDRIISWDIINEPEWAMSGNASVNRARVHPRRQGGRQSICRQASLRDAILKLPISGLSAEPVGWVESRDWRETNAESCA